MKKSALNTLTKTLLYVCFGAGIAYSFALPFYILFKIPGFAPVLNERYSTYIICWECGMVCVLIIIHTLIQMMKTLDSDPFIMENVLYLKRMGMVALVLVVFTLIEFLLYLSPIMLIIAMMELMCALFALVLRGVFEKAVEYREENALTI